MYNESIVTRAEVVENTAVSGNLDTTKFMQFVRIAQEIHIQGFLGTKLYDRILADIQNDTLTGDYLDLVNKYVKPMTIHWAMVEYLPFAAYTVSNKGVYKHGAENSTTVDKGEVDFLLEKQRNTAQHYTNRFIDFMCYNKSKFPEYEQNENEDVYPNTKADFGGWEI
jgi:hypothetical protein